MSPNPHIWESPLNYLTQSTNYKLQIVCLVVVVGARFSSFPFHRYTCSVCKLCMCTHLHSFMYIRVCMQSSPSLAIIMNGFNDTKSKSDNNLQLMQVEQLSHSCLVFWELLS